MSKIKVAFLFGGRSTEHEVSVITAIQAYENLDRSKYEVIPIYVSKQGRFYTGSQFLELKKYKDIDQLLLSSSEVNPDRKDHMKGISTKSLIKKFTPVDIAFPIFHGAYGEDGCIQGLFEMYQIPYIGFNVLASAVAMDKTMSKALFQSLDLNVAKFFSISRNQFQQDPNSVIAAVKKVLKFPMFVKPNNAGSSIGANKAKNEDELQFNIEVAAVYSEKIIIEEAFENVIEVNCSALGYKNTISASVCEMPVSSGDLLSFEDKYKKGGKGSKGVGMASLSRVIPAPISPKLTKEIQDITTKVFKALDGCGVARIDYFVDQTNNKIWINEVNSPPGSLSFYLWEPSGLSYKELLNKLIQLGFDRFEEQKKTQYTFESGLLSQMADAGGIKR